MSFYRLQGDQLVLTLRVQPAASNDAIVGPYGDDALRVRITAPPLDGRANAHLCRFLASAFGVSPHQVTLQRGKGSRNKEVAISSPRLLPTAAAISLPTVRN
jgi:uncharacterized protein